MLYHSTNKQSPAVNFRQATIQGQAPDKGLYFPETIPALTANFLQTYRTKSKAQIAFEVIRPYVGDTIAEADLYMICEHTINFDFPLVKVTDSISSLELFHGPTLAFKDVGARFMSRCLGYFSKTDSRKVTVLVATSGDTGSAVANGFLGVEGVEVIILYPSGKVSNIQELQLTTLGQNITALEVNGTFDDCQAMVKQAFTDAELNSKLFLTSANSINVARWLPQQFYYFYALQQWQGSEAPVVCVPSGNFGNICAGLLAAVSGLPVKHFVAACNSNDEFTQYLATGTLTPKPAVATISNAMDVGNPSNFVRILELFGNDYQRIKNFISSYSVNDSDTAATIARVYKNYNYTLDPHGAVAFNALEQYGEKGFILETAHPVKFSNVVEQATGVAIDFPENMKYLLKQQKKSIQTEARYEALKDFLLANS
ncbi:MAG TPA: threonine synthase [Chitinophagales bacterium]|nr:threonine synthase [Chitinophagales bacterium]